jgi:RNA-directed DNA polymerase
MKTVRWHTKERWLLLYVERWLKAPFQKDDGTLVERTKGTPQGGVASPVLANLFLHYVFDLWMKRNYPLLPFCRYADDGIVHCRTESEAQSLKKALEERFKECKLELHPVKTRIVYCKNSNRRKDYPAVSFDFLGFTFRPRMARSREGKYYTNFSPAVSNAAGRDMRQQSRRWRLQLRSDLWKIYLVSSVP